MLVMFTIIGGIVFGLAVVGCIISCLEVWVLKNEVDALKKKLNKVNKK